MNLRAMVIYSVAGMLSAGTSGCAAGKPHRVTIDASKRFVVDGKPVFPIMVVPGPPLHAKAPSGRDALDELRASGVLLARLGLFDRKMWNAETEELLSQYLDWYAEHGMLGAPHLQKLSVVTESETEDIQHLKAFVRRFKNHPGVGIWKLMDEPQWGKSPLDGIARGYKIVKELDPDHPCWMNHAPRGTVEELAAYNKYCDITGVDIYPVSVPPVKHGGLPNKDLSVVGDYTRRMAETVDGKKPVWMVLQISFSGAVPPHPVVFPTFEQERYMVYQAIIAGADGVNFFGGGNILEGRDKELGWNWTFWKKVLKPVLAEINSPELRPVLLADDSKLKIEATGADDLEFIVREAAGRKYILASKREGPAAKVKFEGVGSSAKRAVVLFEKRSLDIKDGAFSDDYVPNGVHVYRID